MNISWKVQACLALLCKMEKFQLGFLGLSTHRAFCAHHSIRSSWPLAVPPSQHASSSFAPLVGDVDRHNGITVNLGQLPPHMSGDEFGHILEGKSKCLSSVCPVQAVYTV